MVSYECRRYFMLSENGLTHKMVCYKWNYIDLDTASHIQAVECILLDSKSLKRLAKGSGMLFQSHFDELS